MRRLYPPQNSSSGNFCPTVRKIAPSRTFLRFIQNLFNISRSHLFSVFIYNTRTTLDDHGYPELHLGITMGDFAPFYILDVCWRILCRSVLNRRLGVVDDV